MALIQFTGLTKRYGDVTAVDDLTFTLAPGPGHRLRRRQRRGQDARASERCSASPARAPGSVTIDGLHYAELPDPLRSVGAMVDPDVFHPRRTARNALRVIARAVDIPDRRVDEVSDPGRPRGRGTASRRRVLDGDAPAAGPRRRAARRPRDPRARRAGQRAGPRGRALAARPHPVDGGRGPHGLRLQPPPRRAGADHRRRRDHRPRPISSPTSPWPTSWGRRRSPRSRTSTSHSSHRTAPSGTPQGEVMKSLVAAELLKVRTTRVPSRARRRPRVRRPRPRPRRLDPAGASMPTSSRPCWPSLLRGPARLAGAAVLLIGLLASAGEFGHGTVLTTRLAEPRSTRVLLAGRPR